MPSPAIVWLWRPGTDRGLRGTLALDEETLDFAGDEGERLRIRLPEVDRARRHRASPVIELRYRREGQRRTILLFFAEPPRMQDRPSPAGPFATGFGMVRGTRRAAAIAGLRTANQRVKEVVREWAEALRA